MALFEVSCGVSSPTPNGGRIVKKLLLAALLVAGSVFADTATYQQTDRTRASVIITAKGLGMLSFTGDLDPDITGVRFVNIEDNHNDQAVYSATVGDDEFFLWWDGSTNWELTSEVGDLDDHYWRRANSSPIGEYTSQADSTGTATAASDGYLEFQNTADYPWTPATFEVVQHTSITTNNISMTLYRVYDYRETVVGNVSFTNAFGQVETRFDPTVIDRTWRQMENKVFSAAQTADEAVYSINTDPVFPQNLYIDTDDVIVIKYDALLGTQFRINGIK